MTNDVCWDEVFRLANHHRLLPALYERLRQDPMVPASIQSALRARFTAHCGRVLRFQAEFLKIVAEFECAGIPFLAHKGPALAQALYGDAAMRQFGDLDFLVNARDVDRARAVLANLNYEMPLQLSPRQKRSHVQNANEYAFGRGAEPGLVELQWQILPRFYSIPFDIERLFSRSVTQQFDNRTVRVLCMEDQFLVLCVHAAKHHWSHLGMIRDIAALTGRVNWADVRQQAKELGIKRIVAVNLQLARDLLGCEVRSMARACEAKPVQQHAARIRSDLVAGRELNPESRAYFLAMLRLRERRRDQLRFLWRLATTPSIGEWTEVRLPDSAFRLYSGVRLLRLLRRLGGAGPDKAAA